MKAWEYRTKFEASAYKNESLTAVRDRRIELLPSVWKTDVLPLN